MRIELKEALNNCSLIADRDNNFGLDSFEFALDFANRYQKHNKLTLILYGKCYYDDFESFNKLIKSKRVSQLVLIGECWQAVKYKIEGPIRHYKNANDFIAIDKPHKYTKQTILIKGAQSKGMYNIESAFQETNERSLLEINLDAVEHNLQTFSAMTKPETKIMVMIKAFSYGNGSFEIASLLRANKVDYFGVASVDEGVELRRAGIETPIIIMTPLVDNFDQLIKHKLEPSLYDKRSLLAFYEAAIKAKVEQYPIHIKLDSGMHRMGFDMQQAEQLIKLLNQMELLQMKSIFSHLAASDEPALDDFSQQQCMDFDATSKHIVANYRWAEQGVLRHILNSNGIVRFAKEWQLDMVRLGLGLYGINAFEQKQLKSIGQLQSVIIQIKNLPTGSRVGYSRNGKIERDSQIAVLPVGYSDGINRHLSNGRGSVWINGQIAPIVGNISMNIISIDVTGIDAKEGDEVLFFGKHYPIDNIAKQLNTIPYEVLTSVSKRLKRVYIAHRSGDNA